MIILHNFECSSLLTLITKQIEIHWACNYMWHSYYSMQFYYKRFLDAPKDLEKMYQTTKSTQKRSSFISLSSSPCRPRPESKMKTIGYSTTCHILIIPWNPNISHSITRTKTSLKWPKRQGILNIGLSAGYNSHDNSLGGVQFHQFCGIMVCNSNN